MKLTAKEFKFLVSCISNGFEFKSENAIRNGKGPDIEVDGKPMTLERFFNMADYVLELVIKDQKKHKNDIVKEL